MISRKTVSFFLILLPFCLLAQSKLLPYSNGFNSASEQAGWSLFRTGAPTTYKWSLTKDGSGNGVLYHDYPVGSDGTEVTKDWYVSPPVNVTSGSKIFLRYVNFSMNGFASGADYFGIWVSKKRRDPSLGDYTELINLTKTASSSGKNMDTLITLTFSDDSAYFALKYEATLDWFTISIDSMAFSGKSSISAISALTKKDGVFLYPNPSNGNVTFHFAEKEKGELLIINELGEILVSRSFTGEEEIKIEGIRKQGMYFYLFKENNGRVSKGKFIVNKD